MRIDHETGVHETLESCKQNAVSGHAITKLRLVHGNIARDVAPTSDRRKIALLSDALAFIKRYQEATLGAQATEGVVWKVAEMALRGEEL